MYSINKKSEILNNIGIVLVFIFLCNLIATFISGAQSSFFFADDFLGLAKFRNVEGLLNLEASAGRPITNIYFLLETDIFGANKNTAFLITNFLVLSLGISLFTAREIKRGRTQVFGILFSISLLISSGALLPLIFWASNFNHVFSILLISIILYMYQSNLVNQNKGLIACQSTLYFLLVCSNPLFAPFLLTGLTTLLLDMRKVKFFHKKYSFALHFLVRCVLPILYLLYISLPFLLKNNQYRLGLLESAVANLRFYSRVDGILLGLTLVIFSTILFFVTISTIQKRNFEQLSLLFSGIFILLIVLAQQTQKSLHYLIIPILLLIPIILEHLTEKIWHLVSRSLLIIVLCLTLIFSFHSSSSIRSYFNNSPWGSNLSSFNSEIVKMKLSGENVCIKSTGVFLDWGNFIAQIGGENFFLRPEIGAKSVIFVHDANCPVDANYAFILVKETHLNTFVAFRK